jgi:hypothetical protein
MGVTDLANMIGFNFRMTEIEAAIAYEQLDLLDDVVAEKQRQARILDSLLGPEPGMTVQAIPENLESAYYVYPVRLDVAKIPGARAKLIKKLTRQVPVMETYQNIHLLPMFQNKIAYGTGGFPWSASERNSDISYKKGICPVAEDLFDHSFIGIPLCSYDFSDEKSIRWEQLSEMHGEVSTVASLDRFFTQRTLIACHDAGAAQMILDNTSEDLLRACTLALRGPATRIFSDYESSRC